MATASLVLGLVGIVAWLLPFIGFPVTITGLCLGIAAKKKGQTGGKSTAGIVLSIIFLLLTLANSILGALLAASGLLY